MWDIADQLAQAIDARDRAKLAYEEPCERSVRGEVTLAALNNALIEYSHSIDELHSLLHRQRRR